MDSEIGNITDVLESEKEGIIIIGAGGLFGESVLSDSKSDSVLNLNPKLKMAVKSRIL